MIEKETVNQNNLFSGLSNAFSTLYQGQTAGGQPAQSQHLPQMQHVTAPPPGLHHPQQMSGGHQVPQQPKCLPPGFSQSHLAHTHNYNGQMNNTHPGM